MSRKYNVSKRNKKIKLSTSILLGLVDIACVGAIGSLSNGFKDWNVNEWFTPSDSGSEIIDERQGLVSVDVTTDKKGSSLNETSIIEFLNEDLERPVFKEVAKITTIDEDTQEETTTTLLGYVYQDNGGMKFGASSQRGYFTINLEDDYSFNRCKIVGRNYSALNNQTNIYSCDETSISVNDSEMKTFKTNVEDNTYIAPTEEFTFSFESMQNQFKITTEGKRCTLFAIELWTE